MKRSTLITVTIGLGLLAAATWLLTPAGVPIDVIRPLRTTIRAYVEEQAVTELPQDYLIAMPIAGWLEPITLREGDAARAGQIVARLDMDDLRDRVAQAEARIQRLETKIAETEDHRLEQNALVHALASVQALDETVAASTAKLEAARAIMEFAESEVTRLTAMKDDAAAVRELRAAEMELRKSRADLRSDQLNLAALKTIAAVSYIGPKFIRDYIDRKSFTLASTQRELEEARTQLEIERRNLTRAEITAPIDGVVLARHQTRRQFLPAGTSLLTLGRLEDLEVTAEVLTERATRIAVGNPVEIFGEAIGDTPLAGAVRRVYPAGFTKISSLGVEQQRVIVAVTPASRPAALGVAFRVNVRIFHDERSNVLVVPRTALLRGPAATWQVMTVRDNRTRLATVELGLVNDENAEITAGVSADTLVVERPGRDIPAGRRVTPRTSADLHE